MRLQKITVALTVLITLPFLVLNVAHTQTQIKSRGIVQNRKMPVRFVKQESRPFATMDKPMYVVGRFGKFFIVQEYGNEVVATSIATRLPVIQAHGVTPDGKKIVYETDQPTYRVIAEDLETGQITTIGEKFGADITVVSPVRNEVVALALQDVHGTTQTGLLYVNLDTGEERLLLEREVAGELTWSADGTRIFFHQQRKIERPEVNATTGETLRRIETAYAVPMSVSVGDGSLAEITSKKEFPRTFLRHNRLHKEQELANTPALAGPHDNEAVNEYAPTKGATFYTPDGATKIIHTGEDALRSAQAINSGTATVKPLTATNGAQLLHTMNNGLLVWNLFKGTAVIQFIDWNNNVTTLATSGAREYLPTKYFIDTQIDAAASAASSGVGNNLPLRNAPVTQVGNGYKTQCNVVSHSGNLAYAYDFAGPYRAHVLSSAKGKVITTSNTVTCARSSNCNAADDPYRKGCVGSDWGNYIIIRSDDGQRHLYAHLTSNSMRVSANEAVCQGKYIADQGHTGYIVSSRCGDHLHHQLMAAKDSSPATITPSIRLDYADVSSNPLKCASYPSGSTETATCNVVGSFSLYPTPYIVMLNRGSTAYYTIYTSTSDGFRGAVSLSALNLPGNQVLSGTGFSPQTVNVSANFTWYISTLKIVTNRSTPRGYHTITVEGRSGSKVSRVNIQVNVL